MTSSDLNKKITRTEAKNKNSKEKQKEKITWYELDNKMKQ